MSLQGPGDFRPFLTVLYIGDDVRAPRVEQLRHEGIGVVAVHSVVRGLKLLQNFRVTAAICDVADLPSVTSVVATETPVILLASQDADWGGPEVTVMSRHTSSAALAGHVRQLGATNRAGANQHAA